MFRLADLRRTTRRTATDGVRTVHPYLLRDESLAPRLDMAVRAFEQLLGRPRAELEPEVLVQLFGDPRLTRCIVACLAQTYRYRPQTLADVLPAAEVERLAARGIRVPGDLRLLLYRRANADGPGFVPGAERAPFLRAAAAEVGLAAEQVETLLLLDAPERALLTRSGPMPTAADLRARVNFETVATLVGNASLVRLSLTRAPADAEAVRALAVLAGVRADLAGRELVLHGQQDALAGWARFGARVVRLLVGLLAAGVPVRAGEAVLAAPGGGTWLYRLEGTGLGYLGAPEAGAAPATTLPELLAAWQAAEALTAGLATLRRGDGLFGWSVRRAADPLVTAEGVLPALFVGQRARERVSIVPAPASAEAAERMARGAATSPVVALATTHDGARPAHVAGIPCLVLRERAEVARLPALLTAAAGEAERSGSTARLAAAATEACAKGVLPEPQLASWLGCSEEAVAERLETPAARATVAARGLRYVAGFGLCDAETLRRARVAAEDVALLRGERPPGDALAVRMLGRRLRDVTGTSEGIECLIAYLGAA